MHIKPGLKLLVTTIVILLYGCELPTSRENITLNDELNVEQPAIILHRLRDSFALNLAKENKYVQFHAKKYKNQTHYLQQVTNKATPYLSHVLEQLQKRNMPGELALLPMIESSYNPRAVSCTGAAGIWQLAAKTGKRYGLKQNKSLDERRDITAATQAALSYLQFLHAEFNGDWFLALAAYNAGEGRVKRAIRRNLAQNKPTDFWSLPLPKETKNFVPKLLALANLVKHADFNITSPNKFIPQQIAKK